MRVGRGCLAGPVMAAAVILPPDAYIPNIKDSKKLSIIQREKIYKVITQKGLVNWNRNCRLKNN